MTLNLGQIYRTIGTVIETGARTGASAGRDAADTDGTTDVDFAIVLSVIFITRSRGVGSIDTIAGLRTGLYV